MPADPGEKTPLLPSNGLSGVSLPPPLRTSSPVRPSASSSSAPAGDGHGHSAGQQGMGATRLCLLFAFVLLAMGAYKYLNVSNMERLVLIIQDDPYGTLHIFLLVYISSVVLFFPCMVMQVLSGALYGLYMGFAVAWFATSVGQCLAFLLGRYFFRQSVKQYLLNTVPNFPTIEMAVKREGWKLMCLLRLSPVLPYNVLNYAAALTGISFWSYSLASAAAIVPWTFVYSYLGTLSTSVLDLARGKVYEGTVPGRKFQVLWSLSTVAFMAVTTVYGYVLSKRAINAVLKDASEHINDPPDTPLGAGPVVVGSSSNSSSTGLTKVSAGGSSSAKLALAGGGKGDIELAQK